MVSRMMRPSILAILLVLNTALMYTNGYVRRHVSLMSGVPVG